MGDPQGPFDKVLAVLDRHGLLAGDRLAPDAVLVSIGDHFDYDHKRPEVARAEGLRLLRWLASHDPTQVHLILGNHDASRVMELSALSDNEFALARTCGDYHARFPTLPPQHVLARDYASFSVEQRELVGELLLARRFRLGLAGELGGRRALLTHAGLTLGELTLLGMPLERDPSAIARALDAQLAAAVADVCTAWHAGVPAPLSLEPLHRAGKGGAEGGGLLYHRPSNPDRYDDAKYSELFSVTAARRFDPRTLPRGLTQICGHSGHAKCVHELGDWCTWRAKERAHGGLRSLAVTGDEVRYDLGIDTRGEIELILIDGELRRVPADEVALLELDSIRP